MLAIFCLAVALPAKADTILLNDNFNNETPSINQTTFANFTVTRGSVDVISGFSGLVVDLDGSTGAGGRFESKTNFSLTTGTYILQFDLGNPGNLDPVTVSLGTAYNEVFGPSQVTGNPTSFTRTINVLSATSGRLVFDQSGGDNVGYYLDNVSLTMLSPNAPPTTVPEPTTMLLFGTGLAGVGAVMRRRRNA
jgi:hypothetical protein